MHSVSVWMSINTNVCNGAWYVVLLVQNNEGDGSVNRPHSSTRLSRQAPPTYYKDKYRHLLGTDSGKDAAKATKSNSAYGYGKCTVTWVTTTLQLIVTIQYTWHYGFDCTKKTCLDKVEFLKKNMRLLFSRLIRTYLRRKERLLEV